ncbi:MAG: hypothetical protein K0R14_1240 [Burkholderiales bacterium]|jgi:hypothetical protein|nr:hypothetical protein [Burkholderiales bacterium]
MKQLKLALVLFGILCAFVLNSCSSGGGAGGSSGTGNGNIIDNGSGGVGTPLSVHLIEPAPDATNLSTSLSIQIAFNKAVQGVNDKTVGIHEGSATGPRIGMGTFVSGSNNTYTFSPSTTLKDNTAYYLVVGEKYGAEVKTQTTDANLDYITDADSADNQLAETVFYFATGDNTAPTVSMVSPSDWDTNVSISPSIQIKFSEPVSGVNLQSIVLRDEDGDAVSLGQIVAGVKSNTYTFSPLVNLKKNTTYSLTVGSDSKIVDDSTLHNELIPRTFHFTTGEFAAPTVSLVRPSNVYGISTNPSFQIMFSKPVQGVENGVSLIDSSGNSIPLGQMTVVPGNNSYIFSPASKLNELSNYCLVVGAGVGITSLEVGDDPLAQTTFCFSTGDFTAPTVSLIAPSSIHSVPIDTSIQVQFSKEVQGVLVQGASPNITLHEGSITGPTVNFSSFVVGSNNKYTFNPSSKLKNGTDYYLDLASSITDNSGNSLVTTSFKFTTIALSSAKDITSFSIDGINGVINEHNIIVTFPLEDLPKEAVAKFTQSIGANVSVNGVSQTSGQTVNNYTTPVVYTVTAADGSTAQYTVTVKLKLFLCMADGANACGCLKQNDGSGLIWYRGDIGLYTFYNQAKALAAFNSGNGHCGYTDWRIPALVTTDNQGHFLGDPEVNNSSEFGKLGNLAIANGYVRKTNLTAWLNAEGFSLQDGWGCNQTGGCHYWSSTDSPSGGWQLYMGTSFGGTGGWVGTIGQIYNSFLLPVRGGKL